MVLPPIAHNEKWTVKFTEAFNTRGMFTEIDHNYVRKPSDKYEKEINEALKDRAKWVDAKVYGTDYYHNPMKVFNEYMTFGAFLLYCEDVFKKDPETLKAVYDDVNGLMVKHQGFIKMKEFVAHLVTLRKANKNKKIEDLYPALLQWCANQ
jgi:predicted RNA-binding protein